MKKKPVSLQVFLLLILALIWGSSYILMKKGLVSFTAIQVSMLRLLFAFVALTPYLPKAVKSITKENFPYILVVALLGSGIPSYLYPLAITHVDSGITGIINTLTPIFTALFAVLFFNATLTKYKVIGLLLAFIGALVLVIASTQQSMHGGLNYYALFAILATICYGLSSNVLKTKLGHLEPGPLTALTFSFLAPFCLVILLNTAFFESLQTQDKAMESLLYVAVLGVMGTAIALVLFNKLIKITDAVYASSVTFLMPVVALAWAVLDHEQIGVFHFIGLILILLGVFFINSFQNKFVKPRSKN